MRLRALAISVLIGLSTVLPASAADAAPAPLTNLAHLNFLGDTVAPPGANRAAWSAACSWRIEIALSCRCRGIPDATTSCSPDSSAAPMSS